MRRFDLKVVVFFALLTVVLTVAVISFWRSNTPAFLPGWTPGLPGETNVDRR